MALDTRAAGDARGIGRYVRCLREALRATASGREVVEAHRPRGVDVFHAPWIDGALLRAPVPQVVTLHDLVPRRRASEYLRTGLRFRLRYLAVSRADRVIVPTNVVREDALALLGLAEEQVIVVGEAAAPAFHPRPAAEVEAARAAHRLPAEYVVWVGGMGRHDPRKRIHQLAAAAAGIPLVMVGSAKGARLELPNAILTGWVDDDRLAAILTGARALVFPSDDEGFGLPPVEALACGTPVVCSDIPVLREVLGARATFVDPADIAGMLRAAAAADGPVRALERTWEDVALQTWAVYDEASSAAAA